MTHSTPPLIHVEVCCLSGSGLTRRDIRASVVDFLRFHTPAHGLAVGYIDLENAPALLTKAVESIYVEFDGDVGDASLVRLRPETPLQVHIFKLSDEVADEAVLGGDAGEDGVSEAVAAARLTALPHATLAGAWEGLFYEQPIKPRVLHYACGVLRLAGAGVRQQVLPASRLVLLHGPPGSGKTSLARATAQKLAMRLQHIYHTATLVEINAHSLFSRWFSESGKLVADLFAQVRELLDDGVLCVVLLDEVESLAASRAAATAAGEPADAVRAVNALITQLDVLRTYPNVLVVATSNMASAVDRAFVDRADLAIEVPAPGRAAAAALLARALAELERAGVVTAGADLAPVVEAADGLSGRALARVPLAALTGPALAAAEYPVPGPVFAAHAAVAAATIADEADLTTKSHI